MLLELALMESSLEIFILTALLRTSSNNILMDSDRIMDLIGTHSFFAALHRTSSNLLMDSDPIGTHHEFHSFLFAIPGKFFGGNFFNKKTKPLKSVNWVSFDLMLLTPAEVTP